MLDVCSVIHLWNLSRLSNEGKY